MSLLKQKQLASLRSAAVKLLSDSCIVERNTPESDGAGKQIDSWAVINTYPCRISQSSTPSESVAGGSISSVSQYKLRLPYDADVKASDRVTVGARLFEVVGGGIGTEGLLKVVTCLEVT